MKLTWRDPAANNRMERVDIIDGESNVVVSQIDANEGMTGARRRNLTMNTDLYELTMVAGYRALGRSKQRACFDLYYRTNPDHGGFCIFAGLAQVIDYINNLKMYPDDLDYLGSLGIFSDDALAALAAGIHFTGDLWAAPEGTIVFPNEPLIRVTAPIDEAQMLETTLLAIVGHQTLIATKAARLCLAAKTAPVVDFGARRAHGVEAGLYGARAAYIGGCVGTSNVQAGKMFGIPVKGTHAHSWIESFDTESAAFQAFADVFPDNCVLLVDTYDVLQGVRNAVVTARSLRAKGKRLQGIRIDSGDLAYYSKAARGILNEAGFADVKIFASSDLDEWIIESLRDQGAPVDVWCVGTRLITSYQTPALGVVYKLMAADHGDQTLVPKIKISENPMKVTNPGLKKIVRFSNGSGRLMGDVLTQVDEVIDTIAPVRANHPMYDYMKKVYVPPFTTKELLVPVVIEGKQVYESPSIHTMQTEVRAALNTLEPEYKRFANPHIYKVSLSDQLYECKKQLLSYHQDQLTHR